MLKKILLILLISITTCWAQDVMPPDSEVGGDTNLSKVEIPLNQGIWNPDGIATGDRVDYSDITNFRYTDNGLKAVDGYQRINTTAVPSYPYLKSLFQYNSDGITDYSMILAQADDGSGNSVIIQNNSTVPYTGTNAPFVSYAELITNGGFETTGGWADYGTPSTSEISVADYHNGTHSYKFVTDGTGDGFQTKSDSYFSIKANIVYDLVLWIKASDDMQVAISNSDSSIYAMNPVNLKVAGLPIIANEWSYVTLSFISSSDISSAKIMIYSNNSVDTFYIDDISLKAKYLLGSTTSSIGEFSKGPNGSVLYSDGYNDHIWPGQESNVAKFMAVTDVSGTFSSILDWTDVINDTNEENDDVAYAGYEGVNTFLLLHFDNNFTDSSTWTITASAQGNAAASNVESKFGGYSVVLDGNGDYVSVADNDVWANGGNAYQIDCWIIPTSLSNDFYIYRQSDGTNYIRIYYDLSARKIIFQIENNGDASPDIDLQSDEIVFNIGEKYHFLLSEVSDVYNMYINGNNVGTITDASAWTNIAQPVTIGGYSGCTDGFVGYIDEFRIVAGSASYIKNYEFQPNDIQYFGATHPFNAPTTILIGTYYPIQAIKFYVPPYNWTPLSFSYIDLGTQNGWIRKYNFTDNSTGLSDDGWFTISSDSVNLVQKKTIDNLTLYWYKIPAVTDLRQISIVKVFAPMQDIPNVWDQEYEVAAEARVWKNSASTFYDYSDQVNSEVTTDVMDLSGLTSSDYAEIAFAHRVSGIKIYMPDDNVNTTASTGLSLYLWNGGTWIKANGTLDGTSHSSISLAKTGTISLNPPTSPNEHLFSDTYGRLFYKYKLVWDKTLSTSVKPYYIEGIPYVEDPPSSKFPLSFNNRAVLANLSDGPADILISANNAPFIYNGRDSARYRIGGEDELVSGVSMTVKYDSGNYDIMLLHKKNETWQVQGTSPENFKISRLSDKTGCIAPATIDTMQLADGNHIAMWLSSSGVVMSDGTNITRIPGLEQYFDKTKPNLLINYTYATKAIGFFDYDNLEYNLQMPYGASTSNNVWLVYSLKKQKWFKKDPPQYFESATGVKDSYGGKYVYGGTSDGYLLRNEYSGTWFGTEATCKACAVKSSVTLNELELGSMWNEGTIKHMRIRGKNLPKKMNYDDDIATAYTEVDASSKLTKTQATDLTFAFTDAGGSAKAYAYTNTGSTFLNANWEEWAYTFEINLSSVTTNDAAYVFGLCEANTDDFETVVDVSNKAGYGVKMVGTAAGVYRLEFEHWTGGSESQTGTNTITGLAQGTTYFVTIVKTKDYGYNDSTKKQYRLLGYVHTDKELRNEVGSVSTYINSSNDVDTDLPYLYYFSALSVASIGTVKNTAEIDYLAAFIRKDGFYNWADIKFFGSQYDSESDYSVPKYEDIVRRIESRKANTSQIQLTVNRKWTDGKPPELYKIGLLYDLDRVDTAITPEF